MSRFLAVVGRFLTVIVAVTALVLTTSMPEIATANESPSPPALGALTHCRAGRSGRAASTIDSCPAIVRASSSATLPAGRRLPAGAATPTPGTRADLVWSTVEIPTQESAPDPVSRSRNARAPPSIER